MAIVSTDIEKAPAHPLKAGGLIDSGKWHPPPFAVFFGGCRYSLNRPLAGAAAVLRRRAYLRTARDAGDCPDGKWIPTEPLDRERFRNASGAKNVTHRHGEYRDMRLYGTMYEGISRKGRLGPEIGHFKLLELAQLMEKVDSAEVARLAKEVGSRWIFVKDPKPGIVEKSAALYLAIRAKIKERGYQAFSYNDVDGIKKLLGFAPAGAMTLLHDEMDIASAPSRSSSSRA